ncbi:MAG: cell wall-active antibiotics response protein [Bacteroidales bacterium]|nr:cell wall-active antibiotics response protein [Bacteroidales bacterium]
MAENKSLDKRNITGLILIVFGGLLLLNTFDIIGFSVSYYIFSWKTLLIVIGLVLINRRENNKIGLLLIGVGTAFWVLDFAGLYVSFGKVFLPLILITIGIVVITRRGRREQAGQPLRSADGSLNTDYLDDISILGGGIRRIDSHNFKGGNITAIFGGSEFDLKNAEISPEGCVIDVFTMFGGTKLIVPEDWDVKSDVLSLFGGFGDKRQAKSLKSEVKKVLLIKGVVLFGGMEIKSY